MGLNKKLLLYRKSVKKALLRRRKRVTQPLIFYLPHDVIHKILVHAGEVSHQQFRNTKNACHRFRDVMEEDWYNREVDLWEMETGDWPNLQYEDLKDRCLQLQNPSAMYLRGIAHLLSHVNVNIEEGVNLIRQASEKGYDLAIYANACLRRHIDPKYVPDAKITRGFIREVKKKMSKDSSRPWGNNTTQQWLFDMKDSVDIESISICNCIPNSGWHLPFKGPGACDECFWKAETYCFAEKLTTGRMVWP